jgi:glycerate 2-kinase
MRARRRAIRALASPASLKGVLSAGEAAAAVAEGLRRGGATPEELPIADGGEGTGDVLASAAGLGARDEARVHDAFGRPRCAPVRYLADGTAVVEAAEAIPLDPSRLDPLAASSRGLGELLLHVRECPLLLVCLGGTATMDAGSGLGELVRGLPAPTRALCDVRATLREAPRWFGPQKGASAGEIELLERRFASLAELAPYADLPGSGAAGGLGAALAALGAELVAGASEVLDRVGFRTRARRAGVVVTGEGAVDDTTALGKAPAEALRICRELGVRCVVFGGRVDAELEGAQMYALSGDPARARNDLVELGLRVARGA